MINSRIDLQILQREQEKQQVRKQNGEKAKKIQATINNIAEALENGENTLLDKIDSKAQIETLMLMLDRGRRNRISETLSNITYSERLNEGEKPYSSDDVKYAEYPLTKLHEKFYKRVY